MVEQVTAVGGRSAEHGHVACSRKTARQQVHISIDVEGGARVDLAGEVGSRPPAFVNDPVRGGEHRPGRGDELAAIVARADAGAHAADLLGIAGGDTASAEHRRADRAEYAGQAVVALQARHTAGHVAGDRVAVGRKIGRKRDQRIVELAAEPVEAVVNRKIE